MFQGVGFEHSVFPGLKFKASRVWECSYVLSVQETPIRQGSGGMQSIAAS